MRIPLGNRMLRRVSITTLAVLIVRGYDRWLYDRCEVVVGCWLVGLGCGKGATNMNKPLAGALARWPPFKCFNVFGF